MKILRVINGFKRYQSLLYELVLRDIKIRYRRSILGILWTILNPILMMIIMTIVFSTLFRFEIDNFPIYYLAGSIIFSFVITATSDALMSILGGATLIKKVYVPKYIFPLAKVLSSGVNLFFSFIAMLFIMVWTGVPFRPTMFLTPVIVIYALLFSIGLGLILSMLMVFFRDIAHLYGVITMAWGYITPLFYPDSLFGEEYKFLLTFNPMYHFITYMRKIILYNEMPTLEDNLICFAIGITFFVIGLVLFYKKQDKFILYI